MKPTDFLCESSFVSSADAILALGRWAATAQAAGHELSDMVALVAIASDGVQVQMAPRTLLSSELDMVEQAALLGVLAVPDQPGDLRVMWSTEGRDDVRHATLGELTSKLNLQPEARATDVRSLN
jgi:hypothetical protein